MDESTGATVTGLAPRRSRGRGAVLIAATVALGLLSRRYASALPWWLAKNAGDVLYATMAYWLAGFLWPSLPPARVFAAATVFCFLIEFSQLDQAAWLNALRRMRLGGLVLGYGFHAGDLACYVLGAGLGWLGERFWPPGGPARKGRKR